MRFDSSGVDGPSISGSGECKGLTGRSGVRVGLIVQEDEGEARSWNGDGASVGGSVARNIYNVQSALKTAIGLEVGAKALAGPGDVIFGGDVVGEEVLDPDGGRCPSGSTSLTTADRDGDAQVVSARFIVQVVEESDFHGRTILVDSVAGSRRVPTVDAKVHDLGLVEPSENFGHGEGSVVHWAFVGIKKQRNTISQQHSPTVH